MSDCDIGIIGLGVMGRNLAANFAEQGLQVACQDENPEALGRVREVCEGVGEVGILSDAKGLVAALRRPRVLLAMVPAGAPVDAVLNTFLPFLDPDDVIIDGGNSFFQDTVAREARCARSQVDFIGLGISGGSEGARNGACLMAGGSAGGWSKARPLLERICAKDRSGHPCCARVGPGGSGHFVKMVHNGIEYAELQLISEMHLFMHHLRGMPHPDVADVFADWSESEAGSFLLAAAAEVLRRQWPDGQPLLDRIADRARQKGTGLWTVKSAWELGMALPVICASVNERLLSTQRDALREQRLHRTFSGRSSLPATGLLDAFLAAKIMAFSEGFALLQAASTEYSWDLDLRRIAALWQGGCILQSELLVFAHATFSHPVEDEESLPFALRGAVRERLAKLAPWWREVLHEALDEHLPLPAHSAAFASYDAWPLSDSGARLIQGMRDFFGGHGFERTDRPAGEIHRETWRVQQRSFA